MNNKLLQLRNMMAAKNRKIVSGKEALSIISLLSSQLQFPLATHCEYSIMPLRRSLRLRTLRVNCTVDIPNTMVR